MSFVLNRRALLRGVGAGLALPVLECMLNSKGRLVHDAWAANVSLPVRYLGFMIQNGVPKVIWTPTDNADGSYTMARGLQNISHLKTDINQITGLHANGLNSVFHHTDGQKGFWTGYPMHPNPAGTDFPAGLGSSISIDNLLGQKLGAGKTVFPQLTLSLPRGHCDRYTLSQGKNSYVADSQPQTYIDSPITLGNKLLGQAKTSTTPSGPSDPKQVTILDFLASDANRLAARLGASDRARLDQHLTAVREIEQQLSVVQQSTCQPFAGTIPAQANLPTYFKELDETVMPLMAQLAVFAFQCDLTRYILFEIANVPPPVDKPVMYVSDPVDMWDHHVSHNMEGHITDTDANHVYVIDKKMGYWSLFLDAMKASTEGNNNILYNSVSVLGTDVSVGLTHSFDDMPIITVGQAGGAIKTGRHLSFPSNTSFNNLHATLLTAVGLPTPKFGVDGTGQLAGLLA